MLAGFREGHDGGETGSITSPNVPVQVCGEGAGTEQQEQELKGIGRKERMVLRLNGGPGWVPKPSASSR